MRDQAYLVDQLICKSHSEPNLAKSLVSLGSLTAWTLWTVREATLFSVVCVVCAGVTPCQLWRAVRYGVLLRELEWGFASGRE